MNRRDYRTLCRAEGVGIEHWTNHAVARSIERNLPEHILSTIWAYGSPRPSRGALSLTLDTRSIELAAEDDRARLIDLERYRGAYVIVGDDDRLITAARRTRRCRN